MPPRTFDSSRHFLLVSKEPSDHYLINHFRGPVAVLNEPSLTRRRTGNTGEIELNVLLSPRVTPKGEVLGEKATLKPDEIAVSRLSLPEFEQLQALGSGPVILPLSTELRRILDKGALREIIARKCPSVPQPKFIVFKLPKEGDARESRAAQTEIKELELRLQGGKVNAVYVKRGVGSQGTGVIKISYGPSGFKYVTNDSGLKNRLPDASATSLKRFFESVYFPYVRGLPLETRRILVEDEVPAIKLIGEKGARKACEVRISLLRKPKARRYELTGVYGKIGATSVGANISFRRDEGAAGVNAVKLLSELIRQREVELLERGVIKKNLPPKEVKNIAREFVQKASRYATQIAPIIRRAVIESIWSYSKSKKVRAEELARLYKTPISEFAVDFLPCFIGDSIVPQPFLLEVNSSRIGLTGLADTDKQGFDEHMADRVRIAEEAWRQEVSRRLQVPRGRSTDFVEFVRHRRSVGNLLDSADAVTLYTPAGVQKPLKTKRIILRFSPTSVENDLVSKAKSVLERMGFTNIIITYTQDGTRYIHLTPGSNPRRFMFYWLAKELTAINSRELRPMQVGDNQVRKAPVFSWRDEKHLG